MAQPKGTENNRQSRVFYVVPIIVIHTPRFGKRPQTPSVFLGKSSHVLGRMKAGQGLTKPYFFYLHLTLLLSCSFSTALIPTARLSISCGRTAGLASWSNTSRMTRRRAAGQEPAPASFDRDEDTDGTRSRGGMGEEVRACAGICLC